MTNHRTTTTVSRPGQSVSRSLRDVMPAMPAADDQAEYRFAVERVERAERSAEERSRTIRVH
jgi:hypothetical protein